MKDFKIFRRDYLIEISEIFLTVSVAEKKTADNTYLIYIICKTSKLISLSLQIIRIQ